jgi:2,4-dienoyl-CoA reductase-like NADH-dependent reductase (Old Yellow Enzyme family)/thioredoxin reductase
MAQPILIGKLKLDNRLTVAPIVHNLATESGAVTERLMDAYRKKGSGGWALVMVEAAHVSRDYTQFNRMLGVYEDRLIAGLSELAEAVLEGGAKAGIQIMHPGGLAPVRWNNRQPVAPSKVKMAGVETRELDASEIEKIIDDFAAAAQRAKQAGFDLVQLHGAHGFLINQFISPLWNKREDKWGEPAAFATQVIRRVRDAVGPKFPLSMRISGDEKMGQGGAGLEHMKKIAPRLVDAGLDCLDVSAGSSAGSGDWIGQPVYYDRGCIVHIAEAIKKAVNVPVVTAGRINNPKLAEKILAGGRADIVSIGRGALADPDFAKKALEGKSGDVRQCTACYIGCARVDTKGSMCSVNYEFGRFRSDYEITPAGRPKKVMVVGGGIAGMEAARVAALRGHEVSLYEKGETLGGRVTSMAGAIPNVNTSDLMLGVKWLRQQMDVLKIPVALQTQITPELVEKEKPDAVVLATGSVSGSPGIPGMDKAHVLTVDDYLADRKEPGDKVAVIGGQHGAEVALSLARAGRTVTVIEEKKAIALAPYLLTRRFVLLGYIKEAGIEVLTRASVREINEGGVVVVGPDGKERTIEADSVLLALERLPDDGLEEQLKSMVAEIYKVGDCDRPLHTFHAFHSANRVARLI